jgi:vacuolar-type H+-ATPase subunit E/Vma4
LNDEVREHLKNKVDDARKRKSKRLNRYIKELKDEKYKFKRQLLSLVNINDNQITLIEQERFWFTKWTEFDFGLELQAKRSQEVY